MDILLIEDDRDDAAFAREALRAAKVNARVTHVVSAREGLAAAMSPRGRLLDAILLDLKLPDSNGADLIRRLREARVEAPCIVVSGLPDDVGLLESAMLALGAVEFLHKPFEPADLAETLWAALRGRPRGAKGELKKGPVRLDLMFRRVWVHGRLVGHLPPRRFALLLELARAAAPLDCDQLLRAVWGACDDPQIVSKTIQRLRQDLGRDGDRITAGPSGYELAG